jgi:predicted RNA binding protein YcfA (HicA-like mRNA interferase family)
MSQWPSTKARRVYSALVGIGWQLKRQSGSHRTLSREGWPDFVFAFHDGEEIVATNARSHRQAHRADARGSLVRARVSPKRAFERTRNRRGPELFVQRVGYLTCLSCLTCDAWTFE